jgi:WD40 repeat protein
MGGGVQALAVDRDGCLLLTGGADGTLRLWDLRERHAVGAAC